MLSPLEEKFQEYQEKTQFCLQKANSYKEQGKTDQALEMFLLAIQRYQVVLDSAERLEIASSVGSSPYYEPALRLSVLRTLIRTSIDIAASYLEKDDTKKAFYFISFLEDAAKALRALDTYSDELDENVQESYEQLSKTILIIKTTNHAKEINGAQPDPGFVDKEYSFQDEEQESSIKSYYEKCFSEAVESVTKIRSLYISSLREEDEYSYSSDVSGYSSETSGACFIATAAYETEYHPDIDTFRRFRDSVLLSNSVGVLLVRAYYWIGPFMASFVRSTPALRRFLRRCLGRLATYMRAKVI